MNFLFSDSRELIVHVTGLLVFLVGFYLGNMLFKVILELYDILTRNK